MFFNLRSKNIGKKILRKKISTENKVGKKPVGLPILADKYLKNSLVINLFLYF